MEEYTTKAFNEQPKEEGGPCSKPLLLRQLMEGQQDKLGHKVEEILWIGQKYAIYRSEKGVYVQFSDCPSLETDQRKRFNEISPELCELRYLTCELRSRWYAFFGRRNDRHPTYLYDHNIAQCIMLVLEERIPQGQQLAQETLKMIVQRVTTDNTVIYFISCLVCWMACVVASAVALYVLQFRPSPELQTFVVAAMFGATGAMLSVATRLRTFALQPCQQSNTNYVTGVTRIGIGFIAGPLLLLLRSTIFSEPMKVLVSATWRGAAVCLPPPIQTA